MIGVFQVFRHEPQKFGSLPKPLIFNKKVMVSEIVFYEDESSVERFQKLCKLLDKVTDDKSINQLNMEELI